MSASTDDPTDDHGTDRRAVEPGAVEPGAVEPGVEPGAQRPSRWRTLGFVGAACVACCAGPILVAVVGIGTLGSAVAFIAWPAAGLAVAAATVAAVVVLRRHRTSPGHEGPVPVELSSRPGADPDDGDRA